MDTRALPYLGWAVVTLATIGLLAALANAMEGARPLMYSLGQILGRLAMLCIGIALIRKYEGRLAKVLVLVGGPLALIALIMTLYAPSQR